jgi:hypothetical protein
MTTEICYTDEVLPKSACPSLHLSSDTNVRRLLKSRAYSAGGHLSDVTLRHVVQPLGSVNTSSSAHEALSLRDREQILLDEDARSKPDQDSKLNMGAASS